MAYASAVNIGRDISFILRPPRRINVTDAVQKYMRVLKGRATQSHGNQILLLM
jgi:phage terminase large subunit GpA-like protein